MAAVEWNGSVRPHQCLASFRNPAITQSIIQIIRKQKPKESGIPAKKMTQSRSWPP